MRMGWKSDLFNTLHQMRNNSMCQSRVFSQSIE